ncbi:MAG: DMT family transporter [Candidatus Acetothermia bacterium]|nr:DMT family transporter [Candidatus Acetothermia bacterium]MDH7504981.1 DMT family transporter [Candidatus Acetothermia bacterium]
MRYLPQLALLSVTVIWGWTFVLVKEGASELGPLSFLALRFALAFLALLILFWHRLRRAQLGVREFLQGLAIGLALFGGYLFQTWGLLYTTATKSGFITGLSVVLVPLLAALAFKDRVPSSGWLGAGLSALGLGLILLGQGGMGRGLNLGDLLTLLCALCFALQIILIGRLVTRENYPALLVIQIGLVFLLSLAGALSLERPTLAISPQGWQAVLITSFLATALAFFIQNRFQPLSTPTRAAIIFSAEPVFAGLFGYLLLGERLAGLQLLGAGAILSGIALSQRVSLTRPD